ncbi:MAG: hypothetical protein J5589_13610 [Firmicutes bacterium]|nr:hypothetical protein [Bacillota bacterium]
MDQHISYHTHVEIINVRNAVYSFKDKNKWTVDQATAIFRYYMSILTAQGVLSPRMAEREAERARRFFAFTETWDQLEDSEDLE